MHHAYSFSYIFDISLHHIILCDLNQELLDVNVLVIRGVQYVHWVMHKCIMVKVGGEIHTKYVKSW